MQSDQKAGMLHGGNILAKVVIVQWLKACERIGKELPNLIRRGSKQVPYTTSFWTTKLLGKVRALRDKSMGQTCSQAGVGVGTVGTCRRDI